MSPEQIELASYPSTYIWDGEYAEAKVLPALPEAPYLAHMTEQERQEALSFDAIATEDVNRAHIVDRAIKLRNDATRLKRETEGTVEEDLIIAREVQSLMDEIAARKALLKTRADDLKNIAIIYRTADAQFERMLPPGELKEDHMDDWVRRRVQRFNGFHVATDIDKTVTTTDAYLPYIPGSVDAENYMAAKPGNERDYFPLMFVRDWHEPIKDFADTLHRVGQRAPLRPGVREFFQTPDLPITITSANFMPFVTGVRSQLPQENIQGAYAVEIAAGSHRDDLSEREAYGLSQQRSIFATEKNLVVREVALTHVDRALIYIGDGGSDLNALDERVAFYFALRNGSFAKELKAAGAPFYEYDDFHDIQDKLIELGFIRPNQVIYQA